MTGKAYRVPVRTQGIAEINVVLRRPGRGMRWFGVLQPAAQTENFAALWMC